MKLLRLFVLLLLASSSTFAGKSSNLQYLANEGVAVFHGETTLLFDPLFRNDYGYYSLVPENTRNAMLAGTAPFENISAVFVSHHHGDHFEPADVLKLMAKHASAQLYAPRQAVDALRQVADDSETGVFERITGLDLHYGDEPRSIQSGNVTVEAFHVPHSGWPNARTDVQNIAFRVTVDGTASIVHLGDADPNLVHFKRHEHQWRQQSTDVALPPYWFFDSRDGNDILDDVIQPGRSIGVHVPASYSDPAEVPDELRGFDLFTRPGESRPWIIEVE